MADLRSDLKGAFQRRLDAAPMRADLVARVAQRVAEPGPPRQPLALATALAVLLMIAVVGTLLYVTTSQRHHSTPSHQPTPAVSPTLTPSTPPSTPARFQPYSYLRANANAGFPTAGPDGGIWFGEAGPPTNYVARVGPTGTIAEHALPSAAGVPQSMVSGPDGAIWFTEQTGRIGRMSIDGRYTEYPLPRANSVPEGITAGPDGALWFTERGTDSVGRITTSGQVSEFRLPAGRLSASGLPSQITAGPDGALWFTEPALTQGGGNRIGRLTVRGQLTEFAIPTTDAVPQWIVSGKDGNLWFSERQGRQIGRITTSGQVTEFPVPGLPDDAVVGGLAAGPDGAVWFITGTVGTPNLPQLGQLGRIAPDGTVTLSTFPDGAIPFGIAAGPGRTLWALSDTHIWKITIP